MNTIKVKISFKKGTCTVSGINLVTNDYASTKISFKFDDNSGNNLFTLLDPKGAPVYSDYIVNNEVPLYRMVDVTTEHSGKTYVKYTDSSDNIYWYNATDNELYDDEWSSVSPFDLEDYTKVQVKGTLFTRKGAYKFEVVKYVDDSKLTSVSGVIKVRKNLIQLDEFAVPYLSIFDTLMTEIDNIDISATKSGKVCTLTINKKDGSIETVTINDGADGEQGEPGPKGDSGVWIGQYEPLSGDYNVWIDSTSTPGTIPTKVSELTNDAGYITNANIPTKTSDLTNDSGFITSSSLPTKTSDLTNDSGYITNSVNNLTNYYDKTTTEGKLIEKYGYTEQLTNKVYVDSNNVEHPIYRQIVPLNKNNLISIPNTNVYAYPINISNLDRFIKTDLYFKSTAAIPDLPVISGDSAIMPYWRPLTYMGTGIIYPSYNYFYMADSSGLELESNYMEFEFWLEYTKSS